MNTQSLIHTTKALLATDKGILAMDESTTTCNKRFAALGIPQTEEARRAYREMLITTPKLGDCISGVILCDETIRQQTRDGVPFVKAITSVGIIPGIKVDAGVKDLAGYPGEKITEGLDGLRPALSSALDALLSEREAFSADEADARTLLTLMHVRGVAATTPPEVPPYTTRS